jgi:muramoyltetrapeptide carboxypeptidase LdcA involved in peptidoglycan recycling
MLQLAKPAKLRRGNKVAAVSLSWGGAGDPDILWRYEVGKKRLQEVFGLEVVEMPNTLMGTEYLSLHPEKRAEDFMQAFQDESIKGIFTCIGGNESIRLLPYIDFEIIRKNPKVFIGYSDTTISHFMCLKGGLCTYYGASILAQLGENGKIFDYTKEWIDKTLFDSSIIGSIPPSSGWTSEFLPWNIENKDSTRQLKSGEGYELVQGTGKVRGRLIGGCIEIMEMMKSTSLWPPKEAFDDAILFLDTSEDTPSPTYVEYWLRNYGTQGILNQIKGILWGKPYDNCYYEEYKEVIKKVVADELGLTDLPILYNMNFGHTDPMMCLPYGALAEIDCSSRCFTILESGVQ